MEELRVVVGMLVIAGVCLVLFVVQRRRLDQRVRRMPRVPIAELAEGVPARITGTVKACADPIEGGLTGRPCVYCRVEIYEVNALGVDRVLRGDEQGGRFLVDDGTGTVVVEVQGGRMRVPIDVRNDKGTFDRPTPRLDATLVRLGFQTRTEWKRYHNYGEAILAVGDTVAVFGTPRREGDGALRCSAGGGAVLWIAKVPTIVSAAPIPTTDTPAASGPSTGETRA